MPINFSYTRILGTVLLLTSLFYFQNCSLSKQLSEHRLTAPLSTPQIKDKPISIKDTSLSFLSYNVWALPIALPKFDKRERFPRMPIQIMDYQADIVCLQEVFDKKLRHHILSILEENYQTSSDYTCNQQLLGIAYKDCFGGLMTLSKYPIVWEKFYPHKSLKGMRIDEKIGKKGFLISKIETPQGYIYVINIHLYAGEKEVDEAIRLQQIKYLQTKIKEHQLLAYPTFIIGDLNTTHPAVAALHSSTNSSPTYAFVVDSLGFTDTVTNIDDDFFTYDHLQNPYAVVSEQAHKLDYCMYQTTQASTIIHQSTHVIFKEKNTLSDHFGLLSIFMIQKNH